MKSDAVARKYAKALILMAQKQNRFDEQGEELETIEQVLSAHRDLLEVLLHPNLPLEEKESLLKDIFLAANISSTTLSFLNFLLKKNRLTWLKGIVFTYAQLVDEQKNRVKVDVESAIALNEETKQKLTGSLEKLTGKQVTLIIKINPAILGGLILRVGDRVIDGSLKRQLVELQREMAKR